jgi:hypothetical protein
LKATHSAPARAGAEWANGMHGLLARLSPLALLTSGVVLAAAGRAGASPRASTPVLRWRGGAGWGAHARYQRLYDPARVISIRGRLVRLEPVQPLVGMGPGLQAVVATEEGRVRVHLGPRWYLEQQDAPLLPREPIEVTGAPARIHGRVVLIAATVETRAWVLRLRDGLGLPLWSWARRPQPPRAEE